MQRLARSPVILLLVWALAGAARAAELPPRSEGGLTLRVPDAQLDRWMIYYAQPGGDDQLVLRSQAPLRNTVVTTSRLAGYLAAPFAPEEEGAGPPVAAGAFRVGVASLRTGVARARELLAGPGFFDAAEHPEVGFVVTGAGDVRRLGTESPESFRFEAALSGTLLVRGTSTPLRIPVCLTFMRTTDRTMMGRMDGDLLLLEGGFDLDLAGLGYRPPEPQLESVAERLEVELRMVLSTVSPDRSLDPRDDPALHRKRLRIVALLQDLGDAERGYALARDYLAEVWDRPAELTRLARDLATAEIRARDWSLALEAAQRADELTAGESVASLEAVALVHYESGDVESAVAWQRRAAERAGAEPAWRSERVLEALARYEAAARARGPATASAGSAEPAEGEKP